jgi:hypothetical protein
MLLLLLALIVLSAIRHALTRGLRRHTGLSQVQAADVPFASTAICHPCPHCAGAGFVTRMQESMQPRYETLPEFYPDAQGRPATRVTTRLRMVSVMQSVRMPCANCRGTGRSAS